MFRFLVAFFAVCVFSLASVNVAQAGGANNGGGNAGGGKGGGKGELVVVNESATETITVFYRVEEADAPATTDELAALESVVVAPNSTETVDLDAGMYELFALSEPFVVMLNDPANAGVMIGDLRVNPSVAFAAIDIEGNLETTATVNDSAAGGSLATGAIITGVDGPE